MTKPAETLGALVRRIREENDWTLMDVVKNSDHTITSGYVSMIETGQVSKPSPKKLKALANGLRVSTGLLTNFIMEIPSDYSEDEQLLVSTFRLLDPRRQRDLMLIAQTLRNATLDDQNPDQPAVIGQAVQVTTTKNSK